MSVKNLSCLAAAVAPTPAFGSRSLSFRVYADGYVNVASETWDKSVASLGLNGNHQKVVPLGEVRQWVQ